MNSYPRELLVQHAPLMFVAGLGLPQATPPTPGAPDAPNGHLPSEPREPHSDEQRDPFNVLAARLRNALSARRRSSIWDSEKAHRFNVLLVEKNVSFPPRKATPLEPVYRPDDNYAPPMGIPHSPISPLTPSSPLHPDGLIAPIWLRKHIELVPSVFVLFLRLWEPPPLASPLDVRDNQEIDEERQRDIDLAAEIAVRKKSTGERGIKLTVVLMASRRMLEEPSLDSRLSFIRRQSGLDARAALFVLSPLSSVELSEFIQSLQDALFESAVDYYTAHSKRVRRKKNRYPHQTIVPPGSGPSIGRPLRSEGWIVRYEYKMGTFAEFRMEEELARKHYEDCWEGLVNMFSSTAFLPPRTKRWAEAKVLADCVSFKICKLYLYQGEFARALAHFHRHLYRFADLSRGWGIGEETFEFWSWVAKQYRIFAELLEFGIRAGLQLPKYDRLSSGPSGPRHTGTASVSSTLEGPPQAVGLNPASSLQHPGYYYYAAASCTQQRYERFLAISDKEDPSMTSSLALANERKVDHLESIVELYTNAYELFKAQGASQSRLTFHMAYRIAETYHTAGRHELAVKFFERIAKTYRAEEWGSMLRPILSMWCECGRQLGDVEMTVRLLLEMLATLTKDNAEERLSIEEEIMDVLKSTSPSGPIIVDVVHGAPLLRPLVTFWHPEVSVGEPASFQLFLGGAGVGFHFLVPSSIHIFWSEDHPPIAVEHSPSEGDIPLLIDLGILDFSNQIDDTKTATPVIKADLRWSGDDPKVFAGSIVSTAPCDLQIARISLFFSMGHWNVEVPVVTGPSAGVSRARWLCSAERPVRFVPIHRNEPRMCRVMYHPHRLSVTFRHDEPAYLDEKYPIEISITNEDDEDLEFDVDVLLQPSEDDAENYITVGDETSTALTKGVSFGVAKPGHVLRRILYLLSTGTSGQRVLDISVQSRTLPANTSNSFPPNMNETLRTIVVDAIAPMSLSSTTTYIRHPAPLPALLDTSLYEPEVFEKRGTALTTMEIVNAGPWGLTVESVQFIPANNDRARLSSSSLSLAEGEFPATWQSNDLYSILCELELAEPIDDSQDDEVLYPGSVEITWRRLSTSPETEAAKTILSLPNLRPPDDGLVAILNCPPSGRLHHPFTLKFAVHNRNRFRTADIVLDVDSSDAFVLSGPRHTRLPTLLPGTSEELLFNLIPLVPGVVRLPTFKVFDRRKMAEIPREDLEVGDGGNGPLVVDESVARVPVIMSGRDFRSDRDSASEFDAAGSGASSEDHIMTVYPS